MAFAMASMRANKEINIIDCSLVSKSFPNFVPVVHQAGMKIQTYES
jgi:5-enolpyruvylshikimate-3-phosphate synthase